MLIRAAIPTDFAAIRTLVVAAFKQEGEADLTERLRADGDTLFELVAEDADAIVGHIMVSRMSGDIPRLAAIGPLAAIPARQNAGIGAALMHAAIAQCRARGDAAIILLGHPNYYPRFGFSAEAAKALQSPYAGRRSFMALELEPGVLARGGRVNYAPAFG